MPRSAIVQISILLFVGLFTLISFPRAIDSTEFRVITSPLDISVDKSSPAISALEDSRVTYIEEPTLEKTKPIALNTTDATYVGRHIELKPMLISSKTRVIDPYSARSRKIEIARAYIDNYEHPLTMKDKAEELVAQALEKKNQPKPAAKVLVATVASEPATEEEIMQFLSMPQSQKASGSRTITVAKNGKLIDPPVSNEKNELDLTNVLDIPATGKISFHGGSAYVRGYDELVITHEYAEQLMNFGSWAENQNFFRIDLEVPRGELVAQVYNRDGVLVSEGRLDLSSYEHANDRRIDNLELAVFPVQEGLRARVADAGSRGLFIRKNMEKALVEVAGVSSLGYAKKEASFIDRDIIRPSIALLRASLPDFWPSIKIGRASATTSINMFSNSAVETLQKIILPKDPRRKPAETSLVWGRVLKDGKPLRGAVVDLAYRDDEKVVYFNGPIPDENQIMTHDNGEFSIIAGDEGLEVLRVQQIGESILPTFLPTLKGHISDLELQIMPYRQFEFQSFEAFTGLSLPMAMNVLGEEDVLESNDIGFLSIRRRPMLGLSLVEADAGAEFAMTRYAINERTSLAHLPFFKESWLAQFPKAAITTNGRQSIGDVRGSDFTVELIGLEDDIDPVVTYYNPDGSLRTESWGVSDGGYVIDGLPTGLNSIVIRPIGSDKLVTELIVTDDRAVFYSSTNLLN